METLERPQPTTIPAPASFPVAWEDPEDPNLFWTRDHMHFPEPLPLLTYQVGRIHVDGFNRAVERYHFPVRWLARRLNTYFYVSTVPTGASPDELALLEHRAHEKVADTIANMSEYWETELLPQVREHIAFWERFDLSGATMPLLLDHLEDTLTRMERVWDLHFRIVLPMLMSLSLFDELYRDLLGSETAFDAYRLLQGFDNLTVQSGRELWKLSRIALMSREVRTILEQRESSEVIPSLEQSSVVGRAFLSELRVYLNEFGKRGDKLLDFGFPSWIEDPTPVINSLKDFIGQPDRALDVEMAAQAAERERLIAEVRDRLRSYPRPVVEQFEFVLKAAQAGNILSEDHNYWIDCRAMYEVRRVLVEFGRRLAEAGVIDRVDDVFHLSLDELRTTAVSMSAPSLKEIGVFDRRQLVAERKAEVERYGQIQPPEMIGTSHGPPPDNAMTRTLTKFFGGPPAPPFDPGVLRGNAGSPGKVRGTARLIRTVADAGRLQKGDVLVAATTLPPWTPLFATAGAVVTDTGGILSHSAVVAREYGIPAVVGVGAATTVIHDGQLVEVDGDTGVVRILASN